MAKFKKGDAVYHIVGNQAFKKTIIKVLDPKLFTGQRYIVQGSSVAGALMSAMYGSADDVVSESDKLNLEKAESTIKSKITVFRSAEAKKAEEQKAKIEARVGEGKGKLKVQTAINKISEVEENKSAAHVNTGTSSMTVRMIKKVRITDESLIPRDYLVVDQTKVKAAAVKIHDLIKEGVTVTQIPGVEVYEEESIGAR